MRRVLLAAACLVFSTCQCLQPVAEGAPDLHLDSTSAEAFLDSLRPAFICGQAVACQAMSSNVSCDELVNDTGTRRAPLWNAEIANALDAGTVTYDADAGRACLERLQSECGITSCSRAALIGHRPQGEACAQTVECAAGLWCVPVDGGCAQCQPLPGNGDETTDYVACPEGFAALTDGGFRCHAFGGSEASCAPAADEQWTIACAPGLVCLSGSCDTPLAEGATCAGAGCGLGLGCATDGTCHKLGDVGDACPCRKGLECRGGACALLRAEGEACLVSSDCRAPLSCVVGACARLAGPGASCTTESDCEAPLVCRANHTCGSAVGLGESCSAPADCAYSLTCDQGRCSLRVCQ